MLKLRNAQSEDSELIVQYINDLADFEQLSHACDAESPKIQKWLFGTMPRAHCLMAEWDGASAGFVVYFYNFSTFLCAPSFYIEDIFVRRSFRRKGIAKSIFQYLAQKALSEGCGRL